MTFPRADYFTWNTISPRLGFNLKLTGDGKTVLKGHWGRYHRTITTGDFSNVVGPSIPPIYFGTSFNFATDEFENLDLLRDNTNLHLDNDMKSPYTDQLIFSVDRELTTDLGLSLIYVNKRGRDYAAWRDLTGVYEQVPYVDNVGAEATGQTITVFQLVSDVADRSFLMTNSDQMKTDINAFTAQVTKRMSSNWQLTSSLTYLKSEGRLGASACRQYRSAERAPVQFVRAEPQRLRQHRGHSPRRSPVDVQEPARLSASARFSRRHELHVLGRRSENSKGADSSRDRNPHAHPYVASSGIGTVPDPEPPRPQGAKGLRARRPGHADRALPGCIEPAERRRVRERGQTVATSATFNVPRCLHLPPPVHGRSEVHVLGFLALRPRALARGRRAFTRAGFGNPLSPPRLEGDRQGRRNRRPAPLRRKPKPHRAEARLPREGRAPREADPPVAAPLLSAARCRSLRGAARGAEMRNRDRRPETQILDAASEAPIGTLRPSPTRRRESFPREGSSSSRATEIRPPVAERWPSCPKTTTGLPPARRGAPQEHPRRLADRPWEASGAPLAPGLFRE